MTQTRARHVEEDEDWQEPIAPVPLQDTAQGAWWIERGEDGARIRTSLHPGQKAAMDSEARVTLMLAGAQSGKTVLGPLWLEREIRRRGPGDYLAVTATFPLLTRKMLPEFLKYFRETLRLGKWSFGQKVFTFYDGETRVIFGSATNSESLESATAKAAWLDEAGQLQFKIDSWEAIQRRLGLEMGRILITTTPYVAANWLRKDVYERAVAGDPDYKVVQFASVMNPRFPKEEYDRIKRSQPAWKVRMFYEGLFDQPPGLIYSVYMDSYRETGGHLVRAFPIPGWWPRYIGLDFGSSNTAKLYIAHDPLQDTYYVYDEQLSGGKTALGHAQEIIQTLAGAPLRGVWGGSKSEAGWRMEFTQAGIEVQDPDIYDVEVGIDRGIGLFQARKCFVFDSCKGFRDELATYSRPVDVDGTVLPGIVDKNRYHRLDAFRAFALGVGGGPEPMPILFMGSARGWSPGLR